MFSGSLNHFRKYVGAHHIHASRDAAVGWITHMLQNLLKDITLSEEKSNKLCIDDSQTNCRFRCFNIEEILHDCGCFSLHSQRV